MDSAYLSAIERGWHAVTIPTALRIAAALRVDLSDLIRSLGPVSKRLEDVPEASS